MSPITTPDALIELVVRLSISIYIKAHAPSCYPYEIKKKNLTLQLTFHICMAPLLKTSSLVLLLLLFSLFSHSSSGTADGLNSGMKLALGEQLQVGVLKMRKLLLNVGVDAVLDYDYGGPNPRHDPRKGKPPPGGRS